MDSVNRTISKETLDNFWESNLLKYGMDENGDLNAIYIGANGSQKIGQELGPDTGDITTATTTTVKSVGASERAKVYGVSVASTTAGADLAGTITVFVGAVQIGVKVSAIKGGGAHWFFPLNSNFIHGALDGDITIVTDTAENLSYAVYHEVYTT